MTKVFDSKEIAISAFRFENFKSSSLASPIANSLLHPFIKQIFNNGPAA